MEQLNELERQIVELIVDCCNLDFTPENLSPDTPIIGPQSPFGLDSLDAVEIVVAVQKKFGVRIANQETSRKVLSSIGSLAAYVAKHRE